MRTINPIAADASLANLLRPSPPKPNNKTCLPGNASSLHMPKHVLQVLSTKSMDI